MRAIPWDHALDLGIPEMDAEHRELVERMNGLIVAMGSDTNERRIVALAQDIGLFTARHFAHEEASMLARSYPSLPAHKAEHDRLLGQLDHLADRLDSDGMAAIDDELLAFLHHWVVHHIVTMDLAYAHFLTREGVGFD